MKPKRSAGTPTANGQPLKIALRLWDLSEWCRQVVRGVQRFAHDRPLWRLYIDSGTPGRSRVLHGELQWDGVISGVLKEEAAWLSLLRRDRPKLVAISAAVPSSLRAMPAVRVDDSKVAQAIGRHFFAGGFRNIAYAANAQSVMDDFRGKGVEAFAAAHDISCSIYHQKTVGPMHLPTLTRWIRKLPKPVGIATWNMEVARNTVDACQRAGISVPEEVGIVAWDDDVMLAETSEPTISAIVLPAERLGFEAARQLDRLLAGDPRPDKPRLIEPSGVLHVRQSSDVSTLKDRDVHLATQLIRERAATSFKVNQLCKALGVSRRKLEQDFSRVTGHTLHQAIVQVRLERAKQLLLETDWSLEKVADRSGLGTLRTMQRLFVAQDHLTPTDYRARVVAAHAPKTM